MRQLLSSERFALMVDRLCHQLVENHDTFRDCALVGIQQGGVRLLERVRQRLLAITGLPEIRTGKLDITFYRDDFRHRAKPLRAHATEMDFLVEELQVVLLDDVLYTGRSVQAALTALQHYGRPRRVELLTLVDRRFNRELPIRADYSGLRVDALDEAYVKVEWAEEEGEDRILLFPHGHPYGAPADPSPGAVPGAPET